MRKLVFTLSAALIVGGCSSGTDSARDASLAQADIGSATAARTPASPVNTGRTASFASMPDRGVLVAYDARGVRKQEAYTLYPVQLSEAHALNAAAPGRSIRFQAPDGSMQTIAYARHEESIGGNWSWVGKTADGLDAIITFGAGAVFGRIDQRDGQPLRLTMRDGKAWLMQVNPGKLLDGDLLRDADDTDVMIPGTVASQITARKAAASAQKVPLLAAAPANGTNTVDVAVGFTNGMVTKYGTAQNAQTRIADLIARTNQAYINSQIEPRVRLVHTLQVAYTDTNDNEIALEALTGVTCTTTACSPATVPAELAPLVTARGTYGADLVSLMRPFKAPEQKGCGIAWLLGGGGFAIDNTDAPYGYSVVGDGDDTDETDGRTYFCREETLAHELGHNMGQQHNTEDSGGDSGTHAYSYGYREATTTGFYTVMAYRLANSSQFSINYFANPLVNYPSTTRPTGTATADNTRSLNQSMPLVAQFRATVVPFPSLTANDLNGNGTSDLFWFNTTTNQFAYWLMNGGALVSSGLYTVPSQFRVAALADLDGDTRVDLIWRDTTGQGYYYWRSRGDGQFDTGVLSFVPNAWVIKGIADLNGDGRDDIIWHNATDQLYATWEMNSPSSIGTTRLYPISNTYSLVSTGDINGDGRDDLVWSNPSIRQLYAWGSRGDGTWDYLAFGGYATGWEVFDMGDVNADGREDLIWENASAGLFAHWTLNGTTVQSTAVVGISPARVASVGDFNGDGRSDVMAQNPSNGVLTLYRSNASNGYDVVSAGGANTAWSIIR